MGGSELRGWIDLLIKVIAGAWALYLFQRKVNTERNVERAEHAQWAVRLYEKFYEDDSLKRIRQRLDCEDEQAISQIVNNEKPEFTDYLNFFELVAFLARENQLTHTEVNDLFGYYLDCLGKSASIREYVAETGKHSYDLLNDLLRSRTKAV